LKQISSKATECPHCGFVRDTASEDTLREGRRRQLRDQVYRLKMSTYGVITVFTGAFGWYWYDTEGFVVASSTGPIVLMALAAVGYLVARVVLFMANRKLKKLDQTY
jgi:hypothetical protein